MQDKIIDKNNNLKTIFKKIGKNRKAAHGKTSDVFVTLKRRHYVPCMSFLVALFQYENTVFNGEQETNCFILPSQSCYII